jgi:flagellar protein FlaJ
MAIRFERFVSRGIARELSRMLDVSGVKMSSDVVIGIMLVGFFLIFIGLSLAIYYLKLLGLLYAAVIGLAAGAFFIAVIYLVIAYRVNGKKSELESMLPDYYLVAAANLRSGIALDRALLIAARPEFGFLSDEIKDLDRRTLGGDTLENALRAFADKYRSNQLSHSIRMMIEAIRYGGAIADLLEQLSKDMRQQQTVQKEISGQLLMYSIFIAFAGLIAAPALYGLTSQMIVIVTKVWNGILTQNPGGLPSVGVGFLKPSPPLITVSEYHAFSLIAIIIVTAFASVIMSAVNTGSALKGLKYLPVFVIVGLIVYFIVQSVMSVLLSGIAGI